MKIIRLDQQGKVVWQVLLEDSEMSNILCAVTTGILANSMAPPFRTMAEGIVASLLAKLPHDDKCKSMLEQIRKGQTPGRFVVEVTELARPHVKEEE